MQHRKYWHVNESCTIRDLYSGKIAGLPTGSLCLHSNLGAARDLRGIERKWSRQEEGVALVEPS